MPQNFFRLNRTVTFIYLFIMGSMVHIMENGLPVYKNHMIMLELKYSSKEKQKVIPQSDTFQSFVVKIKQLE